MKKTLYVHRPLINSDDFVSWARTNGFQNILHRDNFHVTVAFSKVPVEWNKFQPQDNKITILGGKRNILPLGNEGAIVLKFESNLLQKRWQDFISEGCSWDYETYQPHVTISYNDSSVDYRNVIPYDEKLIFGPEVFKEVDLNWKPRVKK